MKPKKSFRLSVLAAIVAATVLSPISASHAVRVTTITYSNWQFAEPGRGEALQAIVDQFNRSQSRIKVETVSIPYASYSTTILTQLGAKSGPDVGKLEYDVFLKSQQAGLLTDITSQIKAPAAGFAAYDKNFQIGGKRFGVPWQSTGFALICNKAILSAAGLSCPTNYQDFKTVAAKTTTGTTQYGFAFRNTMNQTAGWWYDLSNWVYGFGGSWTDSNGNPTVNSAEVQKAVTEYKYFFDQKYVPQGATATTYRQMFWEGKIAMTIDNAAVPSIFSTSNPSIKPNLLVVKNPFPVAANSQILIGTAVNAASKNKAAATTFVNWMLNGQNQKLLMSAMGAEAVASKTRPATALLNDKPWLKVYSKYADNGVLVLPKGAELKTAEIQTAVLTQVDKILRSNLSVKEGLDAAQASVKSILGK